jgi:hypothetical protein
MKGQISLNRNEPSSHWFAPVSIFGIALAFRLAMALQPIHVQLTKMLPDDAFYYFLSAINTLKGLGTSVDGLTPNNGWHPLWMVFNLVVFALPFRNPDVPVHILLVLGALMDSAVTFLIYYVLRRTDGHNLHNEVYFASFGALTYAVNPMPAFQSVNGLETGLAALVIAATWAYSHHLTAHHTARHAVVWGVMFGLCFLARTDTALILIWLGLFVLFCLPAERRWQVMIVGSLSAILVVLPWWIWNTVHFGGPFAQSSAAAVPWAVKTRYLISHPDASVWRLRFESLFSLTYILRGDYFGAAPLVGFLMWPLAIWGMGRLKQGGSVRFSRLWYATVLGGVSLVFVHTLVRFYPRPWYFVITAQSLALGTGIALGFIGSHRLRKGVAALLLCASLISGYATWNIGYYPWQTGQIASAEWIRQETRPDDVIGSMNSGIMGYYGNRTVINLDGVVNPEAFQAIQAGNTFEYMLETQITYLIDCDQAVFVEYGPFMGLDDDEGTLQEIAVLTDPYPGLGSWRVYRLVPSR